MLVILLNNKVKFGIYIANHGITSNPQDYIELATITEKNNWDGFFIWDHIHHGKKNPDPFLDPWVILAGIAVKTEKLRIGTTVTALARRRPWKVARETVSIDRLSNGRLILGVGLGSDVDFSSFGEKGNKQSRGKKLDEALDVITGLWTGKPFSYQGEHFQLDEVKFIPKPVQINIPIWVGGNWSNKKPFRRAAKYDGVFPLRDGELSLENDLEALKECIRYIKRHRTSPEPFDVVQTVMTREQMD
ncbi:MAG: LLM class flavin-dependent oxidoreductase [Candidatus Hodarchaeales archaeon]